MKTKPARFIFVNRFYWPDEPATAQLLTDLASVLAAHRHDVTIVSSQSNASVPLRETHRNVKIVRVKCTRYGKSTTLRRLADMVSFLFGVRRELSAIAKPGDIIVAMTDPPMLGLLVHAIAYLYEARCVHWVQDTYPELAIAMSRNPLFRLLGYLLVPLRNRSWRKAAACVTLGHDMASVLVKAKVARDKIAIIPNWAPEGLSPQPVTIADELRTAWELHGKFVIEYSGNLGRVHDLDPIIDVAATLSSEPDFAIVFIGQGASRAVLQHRVKQRGLRNVHFFSPQARAQLAESLALGEVHLVTLRENCQGYVFPSKIYGIAAIGRPLVFIGPPYSDPARLVAADGFGLAFARGEIAKIAEALRDLRNRPDYREALGVAAITASRRYGGATEAAAQWEVLLGCKPLATGGTGGLGLTSR